VGLFTRLVAASSIATTIVAISTAQWSQIDSLAGLLGLVASSDID
jgi:hypothetical protein